MLNQEEVLLQEAYEEVQGKQVDYTSVVKQVADIFNQKGWKSHVVRSGSTPAGPNDDTIKGSANDGIAAKDGDNGEKYDIYFYVCAAHKTVQFSAFVVMPWNSEVQNNEINIPLNNDTEYGVSVESNLNEAVESVIDEVLAFSLPEGPSSDDESEHKYFAKGDQSHDIEKNDV